MNDDFVYDIETFRNLFSCVTVHVPTRTRWIHEVSPRMNQSSQFVAFIRWLGSRPDARLVGYNNLGFDYPVVHHLVGLGEFTWDDAYFKGQEIINTDWNDRFRHTVWDSDMIVPQVDLLKIHHFDNPAKSTSLKALEIAMRSHSVVDLPYSPHEPLTSEQADEVISYNAHDVNETLKFYLETVEMLEFRAEVGRTLGMNATNFSDTKIGSEFMIHNLEQSQPGITGARARPKKLRQTHRPVIDVGSVLLPYLQFEHPEFQRVHQFFSGLKITETKGALDDLHCEIDGFEFHFGTGGIHGSRPNETFTADDEYDLIDVDVASYYPNLSIKNRIFPAHLSEAFCDIYENLYNERLRVGKKTPLGGAIKLALNSTYGNSNNQYSCFLDPAFTMAITVNGQLSLCMLAEWVMKMPGVTMIQINTDGLTCRVPKTSRAEFLGLCRHWETVTKLELEEVDYSRMFVRDVNNYVGEYPDGEVKLKGAYDYGVGWHQNHSSLVVAKAAEACLIHGTPCADFIAAHHDPFDFCRTAKVQKRDRLLHGDREIQRTTRYHVAIRGDGLTKVMPPLRGKTNERHNGIDKGFAVQICNDITDFDWSNLNRHWYTHQAQKLVDGVKRS